MYSCDQSWIFCIITPVFCDLSEIILICWFAAQETFLTITNVENSCGAQYFCGKCDTLFLYYFIKKKKTLVYEWTHCKSLAISTLDSVYKHISALIYKKPWISPCDLVVEDTPVSNLAPAQKRLASKQRDLHWWTDGTEHSVWRRCAVYSYWHLFTLTLSVTGVSVCLELDENETENVIAILCVHVHSPKICLIMDNVKRKRAESENPV